MTGESLCINAFQHQILNAPQLVSERIVLLTYSKFMMLQKEGQIALCLSMYVRCPGDFVL